MNVLDLAVTEIDETVNKFHKNVIRSKKMKVLRKTQLAKRPKLKRMSTEIAVRIQTG